jgi:hypothetical protein
MTVRHVLEARTREIDNIVWWNMLDLSNSRDKFLGMVCAKQVWRVINAFKNK